MLRRQFLAGTAITGGCALGSAKTTLVLHVKGFSCPTCAVGLETLLGKEPGVSEVTATYPEGRGSRLRTNRKEPRCLKCGI